MKALMSIALICGLLIIPPTIQAQTLEDEETIRLVVEVKAGARFTHGELLGDEAPRTYRVGGKERRAKDLRRWRVVEVPAAAALELMQQLATDPAVAEVHRARVYQSALTPTDERFGDQYGLVDSSVPVAWNVTTGSFQTVIAVIDGGVDPMHEDLKDKVWVNSDEAPNNNLDDDGNGFIDDVNGWDFVKNQPAAVSVDHATHVAGIAAASSNNGVGVAGVDWQARLMSVRVLSASGAGFEDDIVAGINYAVGNGASIINLSLVGPASAALLDAVENAYAAGVVVVAAAGNNGLNTDFVSVYPACADVGGVDMVIGVGATDEDGEPTSFSNYGRCVNISAPGQRIMSTTTGDRYGRMTGTSMSSPFVVGVAGLYKALHPNASPAEVIAALSRGEAFTGRDADEWNAAYKGKLDAALVVGAPPEPSPTPVPSGTPQPSPEITSTPTPTTVPSSSGDSGGGSNDGGGGGGGEEPQPTIVKKGRVLGSTTVVHPKANLKLLPRIKDTFRHVFGRVPTTKEKTYWADRIKHGHKRTYDALLGAMLWHKVRQK